jgi:hypothetical protein
MCEPIGITSPTPGGITILYSPDYGLVPSYEASRCLSEAKKSR